MTDHRDDDDLSALIGDAVADVEPTDRLAAIRARTTAPSAPGRRRGWYVVGGGVLAAAAVVVAVAVVAQGDPAGVRDEAGPAASSSVTPSTGTSISPSPSTPSTPSSPSSGSTMLTPDPGQPPDTTPVYYVGDGPDGPEAPDEVLYRYFEPNAAPLELLMGQPTDPDYRTLWSRGSLLSYETYPDRIVVQASAEGATASELAQQQLVYTMHAVTLTMLPVDLESPDGDLQRLEARPELEVLSHMSISDPGQDFEYGDSFTARGRSNGFEGTVFCQLLDDAREPVWEKATVNGGLLDDTLNPWTLRVNLERVEPGTYTFRCQTDDPTGGAEGRGADSDTRTITVE